ncbi:MAG: acyl-CoA carboxylase subunit beta [Acidimicrobiales bacterium]
MTVSLRSQAGPLVSVTAATLEGRDVIRATVAAHDDQAVLGEADAVALAEGIRTAREQRLPMIGVLSLSGVAIEEGLAAAAAWGRTARELVLSSGIVPLIIVVNGPVVGAPALQLALVDVVIFTEAAYAFVTGPRTVEAYTGEPVTAHSLGGSGAHARSTGVASMVVEDLDHAEDAIAAVLGHLPDHVDAPTVAHPSHDPADRATPEAGDVLPPTATGSYDVRNVIAAVADEGEFLELSASWAPNLVTGFAYLGGRSVGIVANQTQALAGSIDIPASQKGARFVALCDAFNIGLLTMIDTSGFLPGKDLEWRGMIRHGAQLAFAYARATVPRVALTLRKSYGGAYIVMDSRYMGNDLMFAWPSAEVAVMGAKGAVEILHRGADLEERAELEARYEREFLTPYRSAERGSITSIITPAETRRELTAAFDLLSSKREQLQPRRHDNGPL